MRLTHGQLTRPLLPCLHLPCDLLPPRTAGSLGKNDAGDTEVLAPLGNTAGACGRGDFAEALADPGARYRLTLHWPWEHSSEADKAEFDHFKSKVSNASGKVFKDAAEYVKYRDQYFGSAAAYVSFAAESDKELEEHNGLDCATITAAPSLERQNNVVIKVSGPCGSAVIGKNASSRPTFPRLRKRSLARPSRSCPGVHADKACAEGDLRAGPGGLGVLPRADGASPGEAVNWVGHMLRPASGASDG